MAIPFDVSLPPKATKAKTAAKSTGIGNAANDPNDTTQQGSPGSFDPQTSPILPGGGSAQPATQGYYQYLPTVTPGTPGYTPDYASLIQNDPTYLQTLANLQAQSDQDNATARGNIGQALVQFGEVPDFGSAANGLGLDPNSPLYQMLQQDVTPDVTNAAQGLTNAGLSTVAGLAQTHTKALNDLMDTLAARGVVQSGATGTGTNLEDQAYSQNQYNARNTLLQYLTGVQSAFAQAQSSEQNQKATALGDATTRIAGLYPSTAATPDITSTVPSWVPGTASTIPDPASSMAAPKTPAGSTSPLLLGGTANVPALKTLAPLSGAAQAGTNIANGAFSSLNIPYLKPPSPAAPVSGYSPMSGSNLH